MDGISGTALCNDLEEFNTQLNDPVEELYRKLIKQIQKLFPTLHMGYLESCGCAALANCMSVTKHGREIQKEICKTKGVYNSQASHIYIGYLNDPSNYPKLEQARIASGAPKIGAANIQGNRVPQYYYWVALDVLGINSDFKWNSSFDELKNIVIRGNPAQVCKINPGHYIAVKAYDRIKDELIYDDSWMGPNKRLTRQDVKTNIQNFRIRYFVK